jgi:hypothetical protein
MAAEKKKERSKQTQEKNYAMCAHRMEESTQNDKFIDNAQQQECTTHMEDVT